MENQICYELSQSRRLKAAYNRPVNPEGYYSWLNHAQKRYNSDKLRGKREPDLEKEVIFST